MEKIRTFKTENGIDAIHITDLPTISLFKTFDCGQCFRFDPVSVFGNKYEVGGVALDRYIVLAQNNDNELIIYGATKDDYVNLWRSYLALDVDYDRINQEIADISRSEHMQSSINYGNGIRILRQDAWECVISFIISQNNNIPRIKKIIDTLCKKYGTKKQFLDREYYTFPTITELSKASVEELFELKTGFRAKYIKSACELISSGKVDLEYIKCESNFEKCTEHLEIIKGVGLKVASCALLFGFEKTEAFPVDVWMKRSLERHFPNGIDIKALGKNAGIAQQYLFYYEKYNQTP